MKQSKNIFIVASVLIGMIAGYQHVQAVAGEGTATIDTASNVTVERGVSHLFTVVLTIGSSGITANADNPKFTIPAGFTAPSATPVANAGLVVADGNWSAVAAGGGCIVTMGSSSASGQVITVDVTTACVTTNTITLTYKGTSNVTMGATPLVIRVADDLTNSPAIPIATPPTITVTDTIAPTGTISLNHSLLTLGTPSQIVTIRYGESMNPASTPVVIFSSGILTQLNAGAWSTTTNANDTWTQTFVDNATETIAGITATSTGATDLAGHPEGANINGTNNPFDIDTQAPTISIGAPSATLTNTGPITFTITYTGASAVTLSNSDVTINTTGTATATLAVTGSGTLTRLVTLSAIAGDGTLGISIASGSATDAAGNGALASGASTTFTADNTAPSAPTATPVAGTYTSAQSITLFSIGSTSIRYTTDGTDPSTCASGTAYSGAISVTSSGTIRARGCDNAGNVSALATLAYTIGAVTPTPNPVPARRGNSGGGSRNLNVDEIPVSSIAPVSPAIVVSPIPLTQPLQSPRVSVTLRRGQSGVFVTALQEFLRSQGFFTYPISTGFFGPITFDAVVRFQERYIDTILAPLGLSHGTGFVGLRTLEKIRELQ